jgi:hypothetical protein
MNELSDHVVHTETNNLCCLLGLDEILTGDLLSVPARTKPPSKVKGQQACSEGMVGVVVGYFFIGSMSDACRAQCGLISNQHRSL